MRTEPLNLLFVCTANIARSPYAERRARMLIGDGPIAVASAGVPGYPGRSMDREMAAQLELLGADLVGHKSRALNEELVDWADVVLTFEFAHDLLIMERWPQAVDRMFGLKQFAKAVGGFDAAEFSGQGLVAKARSVSGMNSMGWDIEDPYRQGKRAAAAAAEEIDTAIGTIVSRVLGVEAQGEEQEPRRALPPTKRKWFSFLGRRA